MVFGKLFNAAQQKLRERKEEQEQQKEQSERERLLYEVRYDFQEIKEAEIDLPDGFERIIEDLKESSPENIRNFMKNDKQWIALLIEKNELVKKKEEEAAKKRTEKQAEMKAAKQKAKNFEVYQNMLGISDDRSNDIAYFAHLMWNEMDNNSLMGMIHEMPHVQALAGDVRNQMSHIAGIHDNFRQLVIARKFCELPPHEYYLYRAMLHLMGYGAVGEQDYLKYLRGFAFAGGAGNLEVNQPSFPYAEETKMSLQYYLGMRGDPEYPDMLEELKKLIRHTYDSTSDTELKDLLAREMNSIQL